MNVKNLLFKSLLLAMFAVAAVSCSDDDDPVIETPKELWQKEGGYVLNSGNQGSNNSSLGYYLKEDNTYHDLFEAANAGLKLGDTANDMIVYGSKIYIAMSSSANVLVTDLSGKKIASITHPRGEVEYQPRHFTAKGDYVYVSYFNGYVGRIDTSAVNLKEIVQVGRNPEELNISGNKLFVANSGGLDYNTPIGYDKTVSVIDLASFTKVKDVEVAFNPVGVQVDKNGSVYVISMGNYDDVPNTLQRINPDTYKVDSLTNATEMRMNGAGTKIYFVYSQYDEAWNNIVTYSSYDIATNKVSDKSLITDGTTIEKFYKLSVDPNTDEFYIATSDYTNNGDVYYFSAAGALLKKFEVGLNCMGIYIPKK